MLKVAAFTGGKNASPARFRVRQYIEFLKAYNISMTEFAAPLSSWPTGNRWLRPAWGGLHSPLDFLLSALLIFMMSLYCSNP